MMNGSGTDRVIVFDTTLRDGEQAPGASMNLAQKLQVARVLGHLGVDVIEAGFPVASPGDFEAVQAIARSIEGTTVAALARASRGDIDRAAEALAPATRSRLHVFLATSPIHRQHKLKMSREEVLRMAVSSVEHARSRCEDVEFSAEDAARTEPEFLAEVVERVIEAGASTINIPDTVGYAVPAQFAELIAYLRRTVRGVEKVVLSVHCHDDLGLAVANSLAALQAGARQVECTVNGVGERAGNCSLEEVVMILKTRSDIYPCQTGINTEHLYSASELLASIITFGPQPNKAIVGRNAFAHEAGIHQDGYLKEKTTYEIIEPRTVGVPEGKLVLGKHSGRHALHQRAQDLGFDLSRQQLDDLYHRFTAVADHRKKGLMDEEIAALIREGQLTREAAAD